VFREENTTMATTNPNLVTVEVLPEKDHMGPAGDIVGAGGTYRTTPEQAKALVARQLVKIVDTPAEVAETDAAGTGTQASTEDADRWTLKITPAAFLERFPEATNANAALARKLVDAGRGEEMPGSAESGGAATTGTETLGAVTDGK
jgi:hypothetical protein